MTEINATNYRNEQHTEFTIASTNLRPSSSCVKIGYPRVSARAMSSSRAARMTLFSL